MNQNKKKLGLIGLIVGIIACILIGGWGYYQFVYTKSPVYSLQLVGQAIETKNYPAFEKHVDIPAVVDSVVDQAVEQEPGARNNPFIKMLLPQIKKYLTAEVQHGVQQSFEQAKAEAASGNDKGQNAGDKKKNPRNPVTNAEELFQDLQIEKWSTQYNDKVEDRATVTITAKNKKDDKTISFDIEMQRLPDRTWKVIAIKGLLQQLPGLKLT